MSTYRVQPVIDQALLWKAKWNREESFASVKHFKKIKVRTNQPPPFFQQWAPETAGYNILSSIVSRTTEVFTFADEKKWVLLTQMWCLLCGSNVYVMNFNHRFPVHIVSRWPEKRNSFQAEERHSVGFNMSVKLHKRLSSKKKSTFLFWFLFRGFWLYWIYLLWLFNLPECKYWYV